MNELLEGLRALNNTFASAEKARADEEFRETIRRGLGHPPKFSEYRSAWNAVDADPRTRALAARAVEMAAEDLELGAVKIMWLPEREMPTAWGKASQARPGVVYLRTDLAPERAAEIAAHECRHLFQYARGRYADHTNPDMKAAGEADAQRYGEHMGAKVIKALQADELAEGLRALNDNLDAGCGCSGKTLQHDDGWLTAAVLRMRGRYERQVCSDPKLSRTATFCHIGP